jgi:sorbitol-6-phosphate 2-dehydrogenase
MLMDYQLLIPAILRGAGYDGRKARFVISDPGPGSAADAGKKEFQGVSPLVIDAGPIQDGPLSGEPAFENIVSHYLNYAEDRGYEPPAVIIPGTAVYALGSTYEEAEKHRAEIKKGELSASAGPPAGSGHQMPASAEGAAGGPGRDDVVRNKIAVVTGGAQGFGEGIVRELAAAGAVVWVADLNIEGAQKLADELNAALGRTAALPVRVNVSDEASVAQMVRTVVTGTGGIDLYISNAGVLKAGSVREMAASDFRFVTEVNYIGYFLGVKHVSPVMSAQNSAAVKASGRGFFSDIIQINSKSGLDGSNRNGAYAGGKFGGIGLTQSFAKELVTDNIKVNSVCPGNFFDGPLWSDPDRGLFVQYLNTGKVPGAETIEDVKRFYEAKVPMNRGCRVDDVMKAVYYIIDQRYETGQAVPVTGGQIMLN